MSTDNFQKRPPLGLMPEFIWREHRVDEIKNAMNRFLEDNVAPPKKWFDEIKEHENWLSKHEAPKTSVKDYEIMSLVGIESGIIYYKAKYSDTLWNSKDNLGFTHNIDKDELKGSGCDIHAVKRFSDNEVFSVGDVDKNGVIAEFKVMAQSLMFRIKNYNGWTNIDYATKVKQPLFTTEDGISIYDTTPLWIVFKDFTYRYAIVGVKGKVGVSDYIYLPENNKYFSTEQAARSYCELHKPCLSLVDVHAAIYTEHCFRADKTYGKLKELAKQKQSQ